MKGEFLYGLILLFGQIKPNEVIDETLQQFREKIIGYQSDSMILLDASFFKLYVMLYSKLNASIIEPYFRLREEFNKSCSEFPLYSLEPYAVRRLVNICDDIQRIIIRVLKLSDEIVDKYYPDPKTLSSETLLELVAADYFGNVDKNLMGLILLIYNKNPPCVSPWLKHFFPIYKKPIKAMLTLNQKLIKILQKNIVRDLKFINSSTEKLFGITNKIANCSDDSIIDTFGCVKGFVGFNCKKKKSGCGIFYKSIYVTLNHLKLISGYYKYYNEQLLDKLLKNEENAEKSLTMWSLRVDKCIV